MDSSKLSWIANFIWGIADDVLRDLYVRGKYRDVILPMVVLRRLDAVLEPAKKAVLEMKASLDKAKITNQDAALRQAAGQAFCNASKFTLHDLKARSSQQQLKADFEAYLDGFSPNVQDILENVEFRHQIPKLSKADALGTLIEKFLSPQIDVSPSGLDNHAMGTLFEELVRRLNEENNEEAGEHWTPRDAVKLMANLIFLPIAKEIESGTYLLYDGACGTGGMLTVAEETLQELAKCHKKQVATHLYGQEINGETYAICKADRWSLNDAKYISEEDFATFSRQVTPELGDVLYTKGGTTGVARAIDLNFRFQVWVHVAVLKVMTHRILPEYLATVLNSPRCYEQSQLLTRGATNQDLGLGRMKGVAFALPPVDEQRGLLNAIGAATSTLTAGIERAQREIDLLKELRTRLVSDIVTGKLDVREAAARLPAYDLEGDDLFDDSDTAADSEEDDDSVTESDAEDGDGG